MKPTIHTQTRVLAGNKVELVLPELKEGSLIDVTLQEVDATPARTKGFTPEEFLEFLNTPRVGPIRTAEEVDREFEAERNSWD